MQKVIRNDWSKENSGKGWVFYHVNVDHLDGPQNLPSNLSFYRYACWRVSEAYFSVNEIYDTMWHLEHQGLQPSLHETAEMLINRDPRCFSGCVAPE